VARAHGEVGGGIVPVGALSDGSRDRRAPRGGLSLDL